MPTPLEALQQLQMGAGPGRRQQLPTEAYGFSGDVPTQGELSSPFEQEQSAIAAKANAADRARVEAIRAADLEGIMSGFGGTSHISQGPNGFSASGGTQSPGQKMAIAGREADVAKSRIPIEQANVSGETQRQVADIQGRNSVRTKQEEEAGLTRRSHDALSQMLKVPLGENDTLTLPGGGSLKHGAPPAFPTGPAGVNLEQQIQKRMGMEKTPTVMGNESLGRFFNAGPTDEDKAAIERALDAQFPEWRQRMGPGFKFAVPGAAQAPAPPPGAIAPKPAAPTLAPAAPGSTFASPSPIGGNDPKSQQAIDILTQGGHPITPANIAYVVAQLGR